MRKRAGLLVVVVLLMAVAPMDHAASRATFGDMVRGTVVRQARAHHIDPAWLMKQEMTGRYLTRDGRSIPESMTLGHAISLFDKAHMRQTPPVAGPAEVNAGDVFALYFNICFGCASALAYTVTKSALVPATPPVYPSPPLLWDWGGPVYNVKGSYFSGGHWAGSLGGSGNNVDTGMGAPAPYPVWVPVETFGILPDHSIDFVGHAGVRQVGFCFIGFCVAYGGLLGDGLTLFDNTSSVSLPIVP